ncbi:MAG: class I SAM-dependent rRNA methyltransferase [Candidatus Kapaibacterium sp.]
MDASTSTLPTITLKPREDRRLRHGHLWVFSNEIAKVDGDAPAGTLVTVAAAHGAPLGVGIYNPHSLIAVRITGGPGAPLDAEWFRSMIGRALRLRSGLFPGGRTYRLLHSESDGVPGVIVDRFDEVMVVQTAAYGMEERRELLYDALMEIDGIRGVVERNDHSLRLLEGLPSRVGVVRGTADPQIIDDGVLRYHLDPLGGQKTGFYLDQRANRIAMRPLMARGRVLDLFSNNGGFALHALHAGASEVIAVESSAGAAVEIERNRELNGLGPIDVRVADVFSELQDLRLRGEKFDCVIADPPPFARSKKNVAAARKKYVELFSGSLRLLAPEGTAFLATCSHHIMRDTFLEIIRESLFRSGRSGIILEERGAAPDHPIHPMMPETGYLHAAILRAGS